MMIYSDLENVRLHHTAVALGKFDGMHKGHQLLFDKLASYKARGLMTVIFTFSFHPASLLTGKRQQVIYTREEKRRILSTFGADVLVEFPFTKETAHMLPGDFIKNVLVDTLGAQAVVVGNDFHFGYQRSGDVAFLRENAEKYAYTVDSQEKVCFEGAEISATRIREEISQGNMEEAYEMLGRRYSVSGVVVHGKGNGRTKGIIFKQTVQKRQILLKYAIRRLLSYKNIVLVDYQNKGFPCFRINLHNAFSKRIIILKYYIGKLSAHFLFYVIGQTYK